MARTPVQPSASGLLRLWLTSLVRDAVPPKGCLRARRSSLRSTSATSGPIDRAAELARDGIQEARAAVGALRAPQLRGVENLASLVETFPGKARLEGYWFSWTARR